MHICTQPADTHMLVCFITAELNTPCILMECAGNQRGYHSPHKINLRILFILMKQQPFPTIHFTLLVSQICEGLYNLCLFLSCLKSDFSSKPDNLSCS